MTEKEFTAAAERHLDMVYRVALNCLRNQADAEDAAQTAMLRLWRSGQAFPDDDQLRYWLVRVTVNVCKDVLRSPWRRRMVALDRCRGKPSPRRSTRPSTPRSWPCRQVPPAAVSLLLRGIHGGGGGSAAGPEALHRPDPSVPGQRETEGTAEGGVSHAEHLSGDL